MNKLSRITRHILLILLTLFGTVGAAPGFVAGQDGGNGSKIYIPMVSRPQPFTPTPTLTATPAATSTRTATATRTATPITPTTPPSQQGQDWPQLNHDAQRTGYTSEQVDPPYCYAWKWNAVPISSRVQPVVKGGRLFIGSLDGRLYARNATTGAPLWNYATGGPIRHAAAATGNLIITGSYDGYTYALNATNGALVWRTFTGSSATAPLIDEARQRVIVASTYGDLTALSLSNGQQAWKYTVPAAILTTPSLSANGNLVLFGDERVMAVAVNAQNGALVWTRELEGQSLAERFPVVAGDSVIYRSQPYYYFHTLLQQYGDDVMDQAGTRLADWAADWANVKTRILSFLNGQPSAQTFFVLNTANGQSRGTAPVLYTYGSNDTPNTPVYAPAGLFLTYRARHGIQTDGGSVHVTTRYDAELGSMNLSNLEITGLGNQSWATSYQNSGTAFRMTSDEAAMLTMGGNILWVANWERLGGVNVQSGQMVHAGNVASDWPECYANCGPGGSRPFYPLSGGQAYPFPGPRVSESRSLGGAVIANNRIFWQVADAGLAAFQHSSGSCGQPAVYTDKGGDLPITNQPGVAQTPLTSIDLYITTDMTTPAANPPQDLVDRLRSEVTMLLDTANGQHLMPLFLERGFTTTNVWPYNGKDGNIANIAFSSHGSVLWHDPGEFLYTMAMAYPYLDSALQQRLKTYVNAEMARYSPVKDLPYNNNGSSTWLISGAARESNPVVFRSQINNWPPVSASITSIYAVWLWSKNTNDNTWANANWNDIQTLFNSRSGSVRYYSDIAGLIGYYRLADRLGKGSEATRGFNAAQTALNNGKSAFATFRNRANADYPDLRNLSGGYEEWSAPVFYGLTPEIGRYLREQVTGSPSPANYLLSLESLNSDGRGEVWWYLTRAGAYAVYHETTYRTPIYAWSHFLAHAYIIRNSQSQLKQWLDRPWGPGDLYSIQKIVATIQAPP